MEECAICLDNIDNPMKQSCGHIFCKTCIQKMMELRISQKALNCPLCRSVMEHTERRWVFYKVDPKKELQAFMIKLLKIYFVLIGITIIMIGIKKLVYIKN